jgi:hypothetical protein
MKIPEYYTECFDFWLKTPDFELKYHLLCFKSSFTEEFCCQAAFWMHLSIFYASPPLL